MSYGWVCTKCNFSYSPTTPACGNCNKIEPKPFDKQDLGLPNPTYTPTCTTELMICDCIDCVA